MNYSGVNAPAAQLDQPALAAMLVRHAERMRVFVGRRIPQTLQSVVFADDVLQDAWIAVYQNAASFRVTGPDSFERWLTTIVAHHLASALRAAGRLRRGGARVQWRERGSESLPPLLRLVARGRSPSRTAIANERADTIRATLAALPEDRRTALELRYIEGRSILQIADGMGRSPASVRSLLFQARRQLRELLGSASRYLSADSHSRTAS